MENRNNEQLVSEMQKLTKQLPEQMERVREQVQRFANKKTNKVQFTGLPCTVGINDNATVSIQFPTKEDAESFYKSLCDPFIKRRP